MLTKQIGLRTERLHRSRQARESPFFHVIFQIEAGASVAQFGLLELGVLFLAIFYFCHNLEFSRKDKLGHNILKIAVYSP